MKRELFFKGDTSNVSSTPSVPTVPPPQPPNALTITSNSTTGAPAPVPTKPRLPANNDVFEDSNKLETAKSEVLKESSLILNARPNLPLTKPKELDGYVGFANLPNQVYRKAVKKGFDFTLMVVGQLE